MRAWKEGDRVSSIATQYPGTGRIIRIGFDSIEVRWPDGSWSRERPQDLIFGGRDEDLASFNAESFEAPGDYSKPLNPESQTREEYSKNELVGVINPTMEVLPQPWGSGSLESILTPSRTATITEGGVPNSLVENFPIYERMYAQSRQPGAAIPMIAKGVVF
jgi:hypothetical protein